LKIPSVISITTSIKLPCLHCATASSLQSSSVITLE